jgi:hypothetical protein
MKPHMNRDVFHTKEPLLKRPAKICERLSAPGSVRPSRLVHSVDMNDAICGYACDVCDSFIIQQKLYPRYGLLDIHILDSIQDFF